MDRCAPIAKTFLGAIHSLGGEPSDRLYIGRKIPAWVQAEGLIDIKSEGHAILYNGCSPFAEWWDYGILEIADKLQSEGGVSRATLDEFFTLYRDLSYWTTTIAFTATTAQRPRDAIAPDAATRT
jgi:hypothetical protein